MFPHNVNESISLRKLLNEQTISGSVPCRVDCGNTLDVRPLGLLLYSIHPVTVNIALDLRTRVTLYPFEDGYVKISSSGFPDYSFSLSAAPLDSPIGLLAAILCHFNVHGVHIEIISESPPRSGLGGSGALAICTIAVLNAALIRLGYSRLNHTQQICLAQNLEEALGIRSGLQDQAAAMYGGVHQWNWNYRNNAKPFEGIRLIRKNEHDILKKHMLVAYTGATHSSSGLTQEWLDDFIHGSVRSQWSQVNQATLRFSEALRHKNWAWAAQWLQEECQLRLALWPSIVFGIGEDLIKSALRYKCGARFCGGGGGGCIWAIGEENNIRILRSEWEVLLKNGGSGWILDSNIASMGLELKYGV